MLDFNWFDHVVAFFVLVVIPLMTLKSKPISTETEDFPIELPPKIHLFYTNGFILIIGCLLVLTSWNLSDKPWDLLGFQWPKWNSTVIILSVVLIVLYATEILYSWLNKAYLSSKIGDLSYILPVNIYEYKHYIFLALAAGICEEIVFRGFLIRYLEVFLSALPYTQIWAIIIPAVAFSISHLYQGWWSVLKILAIAILFGFIFCYSGSLLIVIIIHILVDLISGSMGLFLDKDKSHLNEQN